MNAEKFILICAALFISAQMFPQSTKERKEVSVESVYLNGENENKPANIVFAESLRSHLVKNDIDGAIKLFDTIPAKLASDKDLKILKASLLLSAGKSDEASHIASELLKTNGSDINVLELNAQLALASGNKQKLQSILKQILNVEPNNAFANVFSRLSKKNMRLRHNIIERRLQKNLKMKMRFSVWGKCFIFKAK